MSRSILLGSAVSCLGAAVFASATLIAPSASAHIELLEPASRYSAQELKHCPCGSGDGDAQCKNATQSDPNRSATAVTTFEAGSTITVRFNEFIDHGGRFRVSFDADGADQVDFDANILLDEPDPSGTTSNTDDGTWEFEVTLPSEPCDSCTLQLVQVMNNRAGDPVPFVSEAEGDTYFACADLILTAPDEGTGGEPNAQGGNSAMDDAGAGGMAAGPAAGAGGAPDTGTGGAVDVDDGSTAGIGGATDDGATATAGIGGALAGAATAGSANPAPAAGAAQGAAGAATADTTSAGASATAAGATASVGGATGLDAAGSAPLSEDDGGDEGGCSVGRSSVGGASGLGLALALALGLRRRRA